MPNANYSANVTDNSGSNRFIKVSNKTATGFRYAGASGGGSAANTAATFVVHATNALPLTGGTGADALGSQF